MITLGTNIWIERGETFTIDYLLVNNDGSPYVLSSELVNPYFLLSVATTQYEQANRYVEQWWLDLSKLPRFKSTIPVKIPTFDSKPVTKAGVELKSDDALFYVEDEAGNKTYKYWTGTEYIDYECRIVKTFVKDVTIQWIAKTYVYSITLVDGEANQNMLDNDAPLSSISISIPIISLSEINVGSLINVKTYL